MLPVSFIEGLQKVFRKKSVLHKVNECFFCGVFIQRQHNCGYGDRYFCMHCRQSGEFPFLIAHNVVHGLRVDAGVVLSFVDFVVFWPK